MADLGLLPLGGCRQGYHPEDTRACAFGDAFDDAALAGGIAAFEEKTDLGTADLHPLLHLDELDLELLQLLLEFLAAHLLLDSTAVSGAADPSGAAGMPAWASALVFALPFPFFLSFGFAIVYPPCSFNFINPAFRVKDVLRIHLLEVAPVGILFTAV